MRILALTTALAALLASVASAALSHRGNHRTKGESWAKEAGMSFLTLRMAPGLAAIGGSLAIGLLAAPAALAGGPQCGDTITVSTSLRYDLRDCPSDGLRIGADHVVLDLNGHTIDGDAISGGDDVGVRVDGHQYVTVRGGKIQEFDHAVHLIGASHNEITRLVARRSGDAEIGRAILLDSGSDANRIAGNDASFNGRSGVAVLDSSDNLVKNNRTTHNGVAGMGVFGGSGNRVIANDISDNADNGIFWGAGTTGGSVEANVIARNPGGGLATDDTTGSTFAFNRITGNGDNVILFGNDNVVTSNLISGAAGCLDGCGFGISVEGGSGNLVSDNVVRGGAHGIRVDTFAPEDFPTTDTVIRGNLVKGAAVDGISVGTETDNPVTGTRIESNRVSRAGADGIDVRRPESVLRANVANRNGDLGIFAVPGVTDGGANQAAGNGNPTQCVGVVCG
jgi:parallel beta-helix repeat protein